MKIMKAILCTIFLFTSMIMTAQQSAAVQNNAIEKMVKMYEMTPDQASNYKSLILEKSEEIGKLKSVSLKKSDFALNLEQINSKYDTKILSILDERQKKIYQTQIAMRTSATRQVRTDN